MKKIISRLLLILLSCIFACNFFPKKKASLSTYSEVMERNPDLDSSLTAEDILRRHFDSIGGPSVIENIKTFYMDETSVFDGDTATGQIWTVVHKRIKRILNLKGNKIIQYYTDNAGFYYTDSGYQYIELDRTPFQLRANIFDCNYYQFPKYILNLLNSGYKFLRIDSCRTKYYNVSLPNIDSTSELVLSIDPKTFRVVVSQYGEINIPEKELIVYQDFTKDSQGYVYPQTVYITRINKNGDLADPANRITYSNIKINPHIDNDVFVPKKPILEYYNSSNKVPYPDHFKDE